MTPLQITYAVELSDEEKKVLSEAERILNEILNIITEEDIGDLAFHRESVENAAKYLRLVNANFDV